MIWLNLLVSPYPTFPIAALICQGEFCAWGGSAALVIVWFSLCCHQNARAEDRSVLRHLGDRRVLISRAEDALVPRALRAGVDQVSSSSHRYALQDKLRNPYTLTFLTFILIFVNFIGIVLYGNDSPELRAAAMTVR